MNVECIKREIANTRTAWSTWV